MPTWALIIALLEGAVIALALAGINGSLQDIRRDAARRDPQGRGISTR